MIVRVLGSAAGGGVPQWNCACANCSAARRGERPRRTQSSFAVSADGERWWLVNVSPDIAQQIEAYAPLQPRGLRGTPIAGFLITDANVDHLGGLAVVRQAGEHRFTTHSSAAIRDVAMTQPAFAPFCESPHEWNAIVVDRAFTLDDVLTVRAIEVPGLTPGYDGRRAVPGAVVAYEIRDGRSGASAVFAPVFSDVNEPLRAAVAKARLAFLDGSFWSDDELSGIGVAKDARALGHLPVGGESGSLARLGPRPSGALTAYAHVNNTSPLLDPGSAAARAVRDAGAFVAEDGMEWEL